MVMIEGKGNIPPAPRRVLLSDHEMRCIIEGARGLNRYAPRADSWGKGLLRETALGLRVGLTQQETPIVAGKCGEYAVLSLAERALGRKFPPVDFGRRARGDGGIDLRLGATQFQVKTRVTARTNLVKHSDRGQLLPLHGDAHVFCAWHGDLWIHVLGYLSNKELAKSRVEQSHRGNWSNYVIDDDQLEPLTRLWADLAWRLSA